MNRSAGFGIAFAILLAFAALAMGNPAESHHSAHHQKHGAAHRETLIPPAAPLPVPVPGAKPNPDENGLSRDINNCNKGCIGGNPG